jgi:hypothetical protein
MTENRIRIGYRPLGSLQLNPRNARLHSDDQIAEIARSISRFGFLNPLLVDKDGTIIAGEGRPRDSLPPGPVCPESRRRKTHGCPFKRLGN